MLTLISIGLILSFIFNILFMLRIRSNGLFINKFLEKTNAVNLELYGYCKGLQQVQKLHTQCLESIMNDADAFKKNTSEAITLLLEHASGESESADEANNNKKIN
jgi:hypothetical protein